MSFANTRIPDIPTMGDFVPGFETSAWGGIGAPRDTPTEIVDKLNREINAALTDPKMKARFADLGGTVLALSPAEYGSRARRPTDSHIAAKHSVTSVPRMAGADKVMSAALRMSAYGTKRTSREACSLSTSLIGRLGQALSD